MEEEKKESNFWLTVSSFVVNKRKAILVLFIFAFIYCIINISNFEVNQDITSYLPESSETKIGLSTMKEQFVTYGSARIMLTNTTYDQAKSISEQMEEISGVKSIEFENDSDHFKGSYAIINLTVEWGDEDQASIDTMARVKELLADYDYYISTSIGQVEESADSLNHDMTIILILAVVIIVIVLFISTKAYAEIPILLITFGSAALLNMGTHCWLGEISSITKSIAVVLQLALAIDYAIILCDRYMEEHESLDCETALKVALSKAIPEISSSCLTTVSGMFAMMFMQFKIGYDMGIVLVKAIIFSLVAVFFIMPAVIMIFSNAIDKTMHKSFVPKISFVGKFANATKYFVPPLFIVIIVAAFLCSNNCKYLYNVDSVESSNKSESRIATEKINENFGSSNQLVVMLPVGNYENEESVISRIEKLSYVKSALGLANQEIKGEYILTEAITPRQFAELTDLDVEVVELLYSAYAYNEEQYGPIVTGIDDYSVPVIDMFVFLYDQYQLGYIKLSDELDETLENLHETLNDALLQLKGEDYSRIVLDLSLPVEGEEVYAAMDEIRAIAEEYYGDGNVILVGNSTSCFDLQDSFATDNVVISVLTLLFVIIILFFTFQSAGLPVLLVLTIQGSIWINFSVPTLQGQGVYFIAYLIISAIQMGATIDYAIVISSRYMLLKTTMSLKEAMIETINQAFPTIFTSGTILTSAGFIIGQISTDATVAAIGIALGRGTLISIICVLFVLPQILLLGDVIIEKTALTINLAREQKEVSGRILVAGHIRGYVNGFVDADLKGLVSGDMKVVVESPLPSRRGTVEELEDNKNELDNIPEEINETINLDFEEDNSQPFNQNLKEGGADYEN